MTDIIAVTQETIRNQIFTIRGKQVMMDRDLADVSRNQNGTLNRGENIKYRPMVFTEVGIVMLSSDPVIIKQFKNAHDRFLIIDAVEVYHIGASLKDLGLKWFAFSKMALSASEILKRLI